MSSYKSTNLIKEIRNRKSATRIAVQSHMSTSGMEEMKILSDLTIFRAEKGRQSLRAENIINIMGAMEMPAVCYPYMENQTTELLQMHNELTYYGTFAKEDTASLKKGMFLLSNMKSNPPVLFCKCMIAGFLLILMLSSVYKESGKPHYKNNGYHLRYPDRKKHQAIGPQPFYKHSPDPVCNKVHGKHFTF